MFEQAGYVEQVGHVERVGDLTSCRRECRTVSFGLARAALPSQRIDFHARRGELVAV